MGSRRSYWGALVSISLLSACGPRQFERSPAVTEESGGFESVSADQPSREVIVSDGSDDAWNGVETDGGEDWFEGEESSP